MRGPKPARFPDVRTLRRAALLAAIPLVALVVRSVQAQTAAPAPVRVATAKPVPRLELTEWRYRDALEPTAFATSFDDSKWEVIKDPQTGRGAGGTSAGWYRTVVTIPEKLGTTPVLGKPLQLSVLADRYAEVWINGDFKFSFDAAQPASAPKNRPQGYEIAGFSKPNVIRLGAHAPGDKLTIAILVVNGPLAKPIGKYALKYARLEFAPAVPAPPAKPQ